jgi:hypothetical protein
MLSGKVDGSSMFMLREEQNKITDGDINNNVKLEQEKHIRGQDIKTKKTENN